MIISEKEERLVRSSLTMALEAGAQKARASYSKSEEDLVATLNGEIDKVTHCADSSLSLALFVDGRFGVYSTNNLSEKALRSFVKEAVEITRHIAPDRYRDLPPLERCAQGAIRGDELELVDESREGFTPEKRNAIALKACIWGKEGTCARLISEEGEYSDSIYDSIIMDTNGLRCRHCETSFDYGVELTVESTDGEKYSGYYWDSNSHYDGLNWQDCGARALERACAQIGSEPVESGKYQMVIDSEVASKVVSPILRALNAYSIQQNNSFLVGSLGERMFPEGMTIMDCPHIKGQTCSKLYDSEGVATKQAPIIDSGVVKQYFVNTYMSGKMGIAPSVEDATRPRLLPWPQAGLKREDIMKSCGEGILVTGFNGGNCNPVTGDFSYGVEGFLFKDGKVERPISEMLITGNLLRLWQRLLAVGDDARSCMSKLIPTLAFREVDFSG